MKKVIPSILTLLSVFLFSAPSFGAPKPKDGTITWVPGLLAQKQENDRWCWAAATRMVLSSHLKSKTPKQCEIASKAFDTDCCKTPTPLKCYQGQMPQKALRAFGMDVTSRNGTNFHAVASEIRRGNSVLIIANPGGAQHAMVAYGTFIGTDNLSYLVIWDPYTSRKSTISEKRASWDAVIFAD